MATARTYKVTAGLPQYLVLPTQNPEAPFKEERIYMLQDRVLAVFPENPRLARRSDANLGHRFCCYGNSRGGPSAKCERRASSR